ncbi:Arrestin domain-containing protein 3 [Xenoophorus captivus]|uniref:Arrestin domain-containing protein 3 n=1 Tax=Xenoophorus captivus TaxID=1517983 RepID=A0ABV0Q576_9TELE
MVCEQAPQAGTKEKTLCCWFCASGPISLSAKIERKGYTPGESIQIFAEVENCSSRVVVPKAALYQTQTFFAKGKGRQIQQLVSNLRGEPLQQGKSQSWEGKMLKIPPVSPSILDCPIIRVEYALMVYVDIPGGLNLSLSLPLVIGTIPLHACATRTSSISSNCSSVSWMGLSERPEGTYKETQCGHVFCPEALVGQSDILQLLVFFSSAKLQRSGNIRGSQAELSAGL